MNELNQAVQNFKNAAKNAGFYQDSKPVMLKKGSTMLIKTSRAVAGRAIVNN
jgi:hypothetical protein